MTSKPAMQSGRVFLSRKAFFLVWVGFATPAATFVAGLCFSEQDQELALLRRPKFRVEF